MSEVTRKDGQVRIRAEGDIIASVASELKKELLSLLADKPSELAIDLSGVTMVDSVGLGVLIAAYNSLDKMGGKLVLINASNDIQSLLKTMRLDKHFTLIAG